METNSQNEPLAPNSPPKQSGTQTVSQKKKKLNIPSTYILSQAFVMTFLA